jgi:hypothetical protein
MKKIKQVFLAGILLMTTAFSGYSQSNHAAAIASADTTCFSVNKSAGWLLYNSNASLNAAADTVFLEIIVEHRKDNPLKEYQFLGSLKFARHLPGKEQEFTIDLITHAYDFRVGIDGRCHIRLSRGALPAGESVVIPVNVVYGVTGR